MEDLPELHNHQHQLSLIHQDMLVVKELDLLNIKQVVVLVLGVLEDLVIQISQLQVSLAEVQVVMVDRIIF